jgi:membrane-bound serine protease (ClpP class)
MRRAGALCLAAGISLLAAARASASLMYVISVEGVIDPPTASYIRRAISLAERRSAEALVIELNTPGGSLAATEEITQALLNARVVTVVYVSPVGAKAASAGTFITMAAHVAAMAPGSTIGAARPVFIGSESVPPEVSEKAASHAASVLRAIAERRGRNAEWAEQAVKKSSSVPAGRAVKEKIVDLVAEDLHELVDKLDGRRVVLLPGKIVKLRTSTARTEELPATISERFLHALAHPEIAYILITIGVLGIIAELNHPGLIFPGTTGVICLVLAFYSLSVLSVNMAGLALILLGLGLLVADIWATSHGVLTGVGVISFVVGSIMLTGGYPPELRVAWQIIVAMTTVTCGFFIFVIGMGIRAQRAPVATGKQALVGKAALVRTPIDPMGSVFVAGELWRARTDGEPIEEGEEAEIVAVEGLTLHVRKRK